MRARSRVGWSEFGPTLTIATPPKRRGASEFDKRTMNRFGYCRDLNPTQAEDATAYDWRWLLRTYGPDGPYAA